MNNAENNSALSQDEARIKRRAVRVHSVLGIAGIVGVTVIAFFPERAHAVAPLFFLVSGLHIALALDIHDGVVRFFPRKRGKTSNAN